MTEAATPSRACVHPFDRVQKLKIVGSRDRSIDMVLWCADCGGFRKRKDVKDLNDLDRSPWEDWKLPSGIAP